MRTRSSGWFMVLMLAPGAVQGAVLRVPSDYSTIQAAITAAAPGDEIRVAPGTYDENLDTQGKALWLRSEAGPELTIVDGGRRNRVLRCGGGIIEGFTFQTGYHSDTGGGIFCQSSTDETIIRNNVIRDNIVGSPDHGDGGGVYVDYGMAVLVETNRITGNNAGGEGGGLFVCCNHTVRKNHIENNFAGIHSGGLSAVGGLVSENLIKSNVAQQWAAGMSAGGGLIENNTVVFNFNLTTSVAVAGIDLHGETVARRNIIARNAGFGGSGGGIACGPDDTIECNDSWNNSNDDYMVFGVLCDSTGRRNFSEDPLFCGPNDFSISVSSPCASGPSGCGHLGAFPPACGAVATRRSTWGSLKTLYR